jgi:uncharacterized protein
MRIHAWNRTQSVSLGADIDVADTSAKRRTGLLRHSGLAPGEGLLIAPCEAVHTFGMKFPIDVVFLDKAKRVVKVSPHLRRSRIAFRLRAAYVLELPAGTIAQTGTIKGDQLDLLPLSPASSPEVAST